jgi:hypothetical protein
MIVQLQIPDSLAEGYKNTAPTGKTLEQVLVDQLQKFASARPDERFIIIGTAHREELEALTTQVPLQNAAQLVRAVRDLAGVEIGKIRLRWTALQLAEIKRKAERWGTTPELWVEANVRRILEEQVLSTSPRPGEMLEPKPAPAAVPPAPAPAVVRR